MAERRVEVTVIGPSPPGQLRVRLGHREREVPIERVPQSLRTPNSQFIAVVQDGDLLRVETAGRAWLVIQDRVRAVLNAHWDPIGVADEVAGEYDGYIGAIYSMLRRRASPNELAAHLLQVETDSMSLDGSPEEKRLDVAQRLLDLELPTP